MSWVEKITVVPRPARAPTNSQSRARWRGSRPTLGSSRSRTTGRESSPIAMLIRCWLPPESRATVSSRRSPSPVELEHLLDRGARVLVLLEPGEEQQVLLDRQPPVERRLLGNPADRAAGQLDLAPVGPGDPGEDREQRRLAGPVRPDHRHQLPGARPRGRPRAELPARRSCLTSPRASSAAVSTVPVHPRKATRLPRIERDALPGHTHAAPAADPGPARPRPRDHRCLPRS